MIILNKCYEGFESALDLERDVHEMWAQLPGEFQGTVKVTIEYIEEGV